MKCVLVAGFGNIFRRDDGVGPAVINAVCARLGREPQTMLLSIRGHDFDFGEGLSPETEALVAPAAERILTLIAEAGNG